MRKLIVIALLALVLPALAFAGGQGEEAAAAQAAVAVNPAGELPIVNEKVSLSVFSPQPVLVDSMEDNAYTEWLEEQTNIHLIWEIGPTGEVTQKLNIPLAGGDYPGIIMDGGMSKAQILL